ncbi:MAG: hypothetical protein VKN72_11300 [Nostocales cyanobacterium 94392]|nr:hypothetical protein [Nostocales cyanobacterium 94392]
MDIFLKNPISIVSVWWVWEEVGFLQRFWFVMDIFHKNPTSVVLLTD